MIGPSGPRTSPGVCDAISVSSHRCFPSAFLDYYDFARPMGLHIPIFLYAHGLLSGFIPAAGNESSNKSRHPSICDCFLDCPRLLNHGLSWKCGHQCLPDCKRCRNICGAFFDQKLQDGFSTIYWRIYTEEPGIANHPPDGPANGYTILKHLGRLKDLEARLRGHNCLASCPRRLGLWVFSPTPNFESLNSFYVKEGESPLTRILVDTTTLKGIQVHM